MATTINIEFDATREAYRTFVGTPFDPSVHRVLHSSAWIRMARRVTRRPSLFLYYHVHQKTYVFADWIIKPDIGRGPGLMTELEAWGSSPDAQGSPGMGPAAVIWRCLPAVGVGREVRKRVSTMKRIKQAERTEDALQRQDVARHLHRKGHVILAKNLADGQIPWIGNKRGGERLEELKRTLVREWRNK